MKGFSTFGRAVRRRVGFTKFVPPRVAAIIGTLVGVNVAVWVAVAIVLHYHGALGGTALLSYTLGLRHALDADHISAIDLMTRRLVAAGQRPVTVGTWFSLGHSTIVVVTAIVVAATADAISHKFDRFSYVGGIVGSAVSSAFILILGLANIYILAILVKQMRKVLRSTEAQTGQLKIQGGGVLFRAFKKLFKLIDRPWKMYPLGVLFGLGFDTSSEIALLGLSALEATRDTSLWLILIFPVLFTAGMCLLDTTDGALMMHLYTSAMANRDNVKVLYYNIVLTGLTCIVAVVIGTLQLLGLVVAVKDPPGRFWDGVRNVQDRFDVVGGAICGMFIVIGSASVLLYNPWRRWVGLEERGSLNSGPVVEVDATNLSTQVENTGRGDLKNGHSKVVAAQTLYTPGLEAKDGTGVETGDTDDIV